MENYNNELYHYGVKGMKWGVRRDERKLTRNVKKAHKLADKVEKMQGKSNATLQSAKGYQVMAQDARNNNNERRYKKFSAKSDKKLREFDALEKKGNRYMSDFLKTKWSTIAKAQTINNGKAHVDSLIGLTINQDKVDKYEKKYSNDPGYRREHEHVQQIKTKVS